MGHCACTISQSLVRSVYSFLRLRLGLIITTSRANLLLPVIGPILWGHSGPLCHSRVVVVVVVVVVVDIDAQAACDSSNLDIKLKFLVCSFLRSILVTSSSSSSTRPIGATSSRGCYEDVARVSGDIPVQLATRLPYWSACGLLRCSAVRLSVYRAVLQILRPRHARLVADKSLASS